MMFMLSCRSFHILTGIRGACCVGLARSLIELVYEAGYVSREAYIVRMGVEGTVIL